jgi:hypothetical protein
MQIAKLTRPHADFELSGNLGHGRERSLHLGHAFFGGRPFGGLQEEFAKPGTTIPRVNIVYATADRIA